MNTPLTAKRSPFHHTFYIANTMEIFERLAWYGFFTVSSLYMTSPRTQGGLGFSDQERGFLQGIVPFMLYLLPVITGALADRYGYRRMFLLSFAVMCPSYYLLGQAQSFWPFLAAFMAVALGAAIFKPVVVGTVARTTDDSNRSLGFGVFYTMVNVGGFVGPLAAGYLRAISWDLVFLMSAFWILLNFIPALLFYKEPAQTDTDKRSLKQVLLDAREVLGNARLALLVVPAIVALMVAAKGGISYRQYALGIAAWGAVNLIWSMLSRPSLHRGWYRQPIRVGDRPFVLYLLIMAGFWTVYNQMFLTLPVFIRDFVDTADLVSGIGAVGPGLLDFLASVNVDRLSAALPLLAERLAQDGGVQTLELLRMELVNYKVMVPVGDLQAGLSALARGQVSAPRLAQAWAGAYRQVNPEYIVNLNFCAIVLFQVAVSAFVGRWKALPVLVAGILVLSAGMWFSGVGHGLVVGGFAAVLAVMVLALGEMIASPKSQEYVAAIAPRHKTAMFMGYYFVSMALGNLFAGLLSGWAYATIAKDMGQPMLMWSLFGAIGVASALAMLLLNASVNARAHLAVAPTA